MAHVIIRSPVAARQLATWLSLLPRHEDGTHLNGFDRLHGANLAAALEQAARRSLMPVRITRLGPDATKVMRSALAEALLREYPEEGTLPDAGTCVTLNIELVSDSDDQKPARATVSMDAVLRKHGLRANDADD